MQLVMFDGRAQREVRVGDGSVLASDVHPAHVTFRIRDGRIAVEPQAPIVLGGARFEREVVLTLGSDLRVGDQVFVLEDLCLDAISAAIAHVREKAEESLEVPSAIRGAFHSRAGMRASTCLRRSRSRVTTRINGEDVVVCQEIGGDPSRQGPRWIGFMMRAALQAKLDHPGIPALGWASWRPHAVQRGRRFIAGQSLRNILDAAQERRPPPPVIRRILADVADVLAYLHLHHQVVHRGVRPGHIIVDVHGRGCLLGFDEVVIPMPLRQMILVEPVQRRYCAPEVRGHDLDPRADVFSLAAVGREMLAGDDDPALVALLEAAMRDVHQRPGARGFAEALELGAADRAQVARFVANLYGAERVVIDDETAR